MTPSQTTLAKLAYIAQCRDLFETSGLSPEDGEDCAITLKGEFAEMAKPQALCRRMPMPTVPEKGSAMSLIDDIKRDIENGTPGPWTVGNDACNVVKSSATDLPAGRVYGYGFDNDFVCDLNDGEYHEYAFSVEQRANARRIARVPQMEAALLAAEELAKASAVVSLRLSHIVGKEQIVARWQEKFDAFLKAMEAPDDPS